MDENQVQKISTKSETSRNWVIAIWILLIGLLLFWIAWLKGFFEGRILKSKIAKRYGVSTKVLANWIRMLCPEAVRMKYVDGKSKKVVPFDLYRHLGKPEERPRTNKGRAICNREDFIWALGISSSTLKRKLRAIKNPQAVIGMSYEAFGKLKELPPRQMKLILKYMELQGYPLK